MNYEEHSTGPGTGSEPTNPWEERKDRGRVAALIASVVLLATAPRKFFEGTKADAGIWGPLLFVGLITVVLVFLDGVIFTILMLTLPEPALEFVNRMELWGDRSVLFSGSDELPFEFDFEFGPVLTALIFLQFLLLFLPVLFALTLIGTLISGTLVHLLLVVTRTPRPHGFRGTWAAICYANGASLLGIVPVAGDIAVLAWTAVLFGIGLHVVQRVGVVRATILASILTLLSILGLVATRIMQSYAS